MLWSAFRKLLQIVFEKENILTAKKKLKIEWKVSAGFLQEKGGFALNVTMPLWVALRLIVKSREMDLMELIVI